MLVRSKTTCVSFVVVLRFPTHPLKLVLSGKNSILICCARIISWLCAFAVLRMQLLSVAATRETGSMVVLTVRSQALLSSIESSMIFVEVFVCT